MLQRLILCLAALAGWFTLKRLHNWLQWRTLKRWGAKNGCEEVAGKESGLLSNVKKYSLLFNGELGNKDFLEEFVRGPYESMGFYTYRTYDTFGHSHINTAEPANMQAVLNSKFLDYDLGPKRAKKYEGLLGEGIFTAEGERWRYFRQQLRPFFSKDPVGELDSAEKHVTILFQALPAADPQGWIHKVDLMPRLLNFTMDTSAEFLFGKSTNSQLNSYLKEKNSMGDAGEFEGFSDAMDSALEYVGRRFKLELPFWLLPSSRKFRRACQTIQKFTNHAVQVALQSKDKECKRSEMKSVLLHELATTTRNPAELGQQALHVLAAGRETTASAAGYAIMLLSRHPQEYARIRDIVLSYFGTEEAPLREMTASALRACKPVQDVVYEALRLYPSVAVSSRVANKDTILPRGGGIDGSQPIAVRKGEEVKYSAYVMQRRHDIWGKDADEFCPTRWETRKLGPDIIPFSIGPRTCLGNQFALNQASFLLVKFAQRYDKIEHLDADSPIITRVNAILMPMDGVWVRLHQAGETI